jgi:hypothetical protein
MDVRDPMDVRDKYKRRTGTGRIWCMLSDSIHERWWPGKYNRVIQERQECPPMKKGRHPMVSRKDQKRLEELRRRKPKPRKMTRSGLPTTCGVKTQWGFCAAYTEDGMCARHYEEFLRK